MPESLISALLDPACYPHAVDAVTLLETHISWVLLAGDFAYKIKKPIKLPFVDFSTLALRKHFCDEELRLNRRFAEQLYLAVVPIVGAVNAPSVGGLGEPIEYAVKLQRFRTENELAKLLDVKHVSNEDLAQFGGEFAQIQTRLPIATSASSEHIERTTEENINELVQLIGPSDELTLIANRLQQLYSQLRELIAQRCRDGFVRECHGDLHAGNIVRVDNRLLAFDCIEFDAKLRNIDVVHDIAFLVMDLQARGRNDLAYVFLNAWLEASGDFSGIRMLPYSCIQRALIRAKVELLQGHSFNDSAVQKYFRQAEQRATTFNPRLILTCGLSGSGKTSVSAQLAEQLPAIHVRSDVERKRLAGLQALETSRSGLDAGIYTAEFNSRTYERMLDCARSALTAGETVIVDAAFLRRAERNQFRSLASEYNASFKILHCDAPESVLRERISVRLKSGTDASEATLDVLSKQHGYWEPFAEDELAYTLRIDTTQPTSELKRFVC